MNIENGIQTYFAEISVNPVLTREQEVDLFRRIEENNDPEARQLVVHCNLKFVIQVAQRFRSRGLALEDLIQEGNIGLLEAVNKFDHRLGFRFSTYAAFWIRQAIQVAIRQRGSLIRLPVRKARQLGFMSEVVHEYWACHGRPPSDSELASRMEITLEQARELAQIGEAVLSLDCPIDDNGGTLMEMIADPAIRPFEESSMEAERRTKVHRALRTLSSRECKVIAQRFGLGGGEARSLRKVSARMGLSQEGVRRIEQRALTKLRRPQVSKSMAGLL